MCAASGQMPNAKVRSYRSAAEGTMARTRAIDKIRLEVFCWKYEAIGHSSIAVVLGFQGLELRILTCRLFLRWEGGGGPV